MKKNDHEAVVEEFIDLEKQLIEALKKVPKKFSLGEAHSKEEIDEYIKKVQNTVEIFKKYEQKAQEIEKFINSKNKDESLIEKVVDLREDENIKKDIAPKATTTKAKNKNDEYLSEKEKKEKEEKFETKLEVVDGKVSVKQIKVKGNERE